MRKVVSVYADETCTMKLTDVPWDQQPEPFMDDDSLKQWAREHLVSAGRLTAAEAASAFLRVGESE